MSAQIWGIGAGKGGVGKTFITSGLAITLSQLGKKCLIIDLDPSGANVHTTLGMDPLPGGMEKYWFEGASLKSLIRRSHIPRLSIIQGLYNHWVPTKLESEHGLQLIAEARKLEFDYILLDVGPGNSHFQIQLLCNTDQSILVTTPEPPSIEKTYRLIESVISFDWVQSDPKILHRLINECLLKYRTDLATLQVGFHDYVLKEFPTLAGSSSGRGHSKFSLIVNGTRSVEDVSLGYSIKSVSKKHFNLDLQYLGGVEYDNAVWQTMRNYQMVLVDKPLTPITAQILEICRGLLETKMDASLERAVI